MISPALEQVATELAGRIKLVKVNVGNSPQLQQRFNVMAIPTLMVLRHGQVAAQRAGAVPAASLRLDRGGPRELAGLGMRPSGTAGKLWS